MDMLISDAKHCTLCGGSRSGKTFLLVLAVLARALRIPDSRHVIFRFRFNSVKQFIIFDTLPKVVKLCFPQLHPIDRYLNKSDWFIKLPNGSEIWFGGLDDKERTEKILGGEYVTVYFNECSQIPWPSIKMARTRLAQKMEGIQAKAYYDLNPASKRHWTFQQLIQKKDPLTRKQVRRPDKFGHYFLNPSDNAENLDADYLEELQDLTGKERARFWLGQFTDESDGQLWTEELIDYTRRTEDIPSMSRIVVSIDPSGCSGPEDERSDEVGIIVSGLGIDGHGYVLEDLSGRHGPEQWATIAESAYYRHQADTIVGETNFGGAMVKAVIQAHNPDLPFKEITASRGKAIRAEPIATLYERDKIHHVGFFPELENQMCSMLVSGYQGLKSPDRLDAKVHGLTELFPMLTRKEESRNWVPPKVHTRQRSASRYENSHRRRY
ncbi:MAG: phage terminase large subunit [Candidatus Thiodiazotropha endolucinida]